jgi:hypothetical protein
MCFITHTNTYKVHSNKTHTHAEFEPLRPAELDHTLRGDQYKQTMATMLNTP